MIGIAISALAGWFAIQLWIPAAGAGSRWAAVLRAALGVAFGMGATACVYFVLLTAGAARLPLVAATEAIAVAALAFLSLRRKTPTVPAAASPGSPWTWVLAIAAAGLAGLFVAAFFTATDANPQGGWDAFAIWNFRAYFLTQSETWRYAVTAQPIGAHMEYPLLLSSYIARGWVYSGGTPAIVPIATSLVVALTLAGLLCSAVAVLRGAGAGLLAACILFANASLWNSAADLYAELPLALFTLAAAATLMVERSPRYLTLAGVFAAFAAWTKNEGLLVLAALAIALVLASGVRKIAWFLAGAAPVLCLVLWFKLFIAPPDPLAGGVHHLDFARLLQVPLGFVKGIPLIPLGIVALTAALLRFRPPAREYLLPTAAAAIVIAGDAAVFALASYDLPWLLSTALERMYLQVWPLFLLAVFVLLRRPEDFAREQTIAPAQRAGKRRR